MSSRLWIDAWIGTFGPRAHVVGRRRVREHAVVDVRPAAEHGLSPWHRTQPTPSWFSSREQLHGLRCRARSTAGPAPSPATGCSTGSCSQHERHPDGEEGDEHDAPALELLQAAASRGRRRRGPGCMAGGMSGPRSACAARTRRRPVRDEHERRRRRRARPERRDRQRQHRRPSYPGATQNAPCGGSWIVSVPRGGPRIDLGGVDQTLPSVDVIGNRSMPARRRAQLVLAGLVVLRAVARALEPLRGAAERHAAAQVHAALVQRHDALRR